MSREMDKLLHLGTSQGVLSRSGWWKRMAAYSDGSEGPRGHGASVHENTFIAKKNVAGLNVTVVCSFGAKFIPFPYQNFMKHT